MTSAPATNISSIHGEQTVAKVASFLKPAIASVTTTAPTTHTASTKRQSVGYHSGCAGMPKGKRTADADTVIMHPARMQNRMAFSTL